MLRLKDVFAGYGGVDVIKGIDLEIKSNENVCILGPNGCGKTTLLKTMAGILPYRGSVKLNSCEISDMKRGEIAMEIAMMSQITSVYFSYSVFETVMLGRYNHMKRKFFREPSSYDREFAENCLSVVGLQDIRNRQINELSGGQLQRVFLARALAQDPNIILLDEPTNHLDLKHQTELVDYLKEWSKAEGHTVIGVLHDINLAIHLADKILFLNEGEIVSFGGIEDTVNSRMLKRVYGMDVAGYMKKSLKVWEEFADA